MFSKKNLTSQEEGLSIIAQETFLEGNIRAKGSLRVDGKMEGNIAAAKSVIVGQTGEIKGTIEAEEVVIGGKIFGDVKAKNSVRLLAEGRLGGNVRTSNIRIEEGAFFEGTCTMRSDKLSFASDNHSKNLESETQVTTPLLN